MKSKPFLIAIAAFAVTATGVQAFGSTRLFEQAGLSGEQISAFETARELKKSGDFEAARDVLVEAGVDEEVLRNVQQAARASRKAILEAIEESDYEAFKDAALGTPLIVVIDTEADFDRFVEAHELKIEGKWEEARKILDELGVPPRDHFAGNHRGMLKDDLDDLSDDQQEVLRVARQSNDRETVRAILKEAGIERPGHHGMHW
jgi:hypothetical protein